MITMTTGYKIFDSDLQCRGLQYAVGATQRHMGALIPCQSGLHFCQRALDCLNYYGLDETNRYAEVRAVGNIVTKGDKSVTSELEVVRELSHQEFASLCTGILTQWNFAGWKECEMPYQAGKKDGVCTVWYASGAKQSETPYRDDKIDGVVIQWYVSGVKRSVTPYRDDKIDGVVIEWYPTGVKASEKPYRLGEIAGATIRWNEAGEKYP